MNFSFFSLIFLALKSFIAFIVCVYSRECIFELLWWASATNGVAFRLLFRPYLSRLVGFIVLVIYRSLIDARYVFTKLSPFLAGPSHSFFRRANKPRWLRHSSLRHTDCLSLRREAETLRLLFLSSSLRKGMIH
jgi:hypothetical protein